MKFERPALLVLIGASVFAIGASLVVLSLHARTAAPPVVGQSHLPALGSAVKEGRVVNTSELAIPPGDQAVAVTPATGTAGLAGYLGPGDVVDVYATYRVAGAPTLSLPCASLVAAGVPVLDVSVQTPEYKGHAGATRSVPGSVTVLLAATSAQSPPLVFAAQNAQIYLTEIPAGTVSPADSCAGGAE